MVAAALRLFFSVADILTLPCDAKPCHGGKERSMAQGPLIVDRSAWHRPPLWLLAGNDPRL